VTALPYYSPEAQESLEKLRREIGVVPSDNGALQALTEQQTDDALQLLEGDFSHEPAWPWKELTDLVGPPLAGELWFICARPSNGKTTFLMNAMQEYVRQEVPILYVGMEMPPERLKVQWASWACGYEYAIVARKQWDRLPSDARDRLRHHLEWQRSPGVRNLVTFANDERASMKSIHKWLDAAGKHGIKTVMVDHLHRMAWGGANVTEKMAEGVIQMKSMAKDRGVRMLVAAQLRRRGGDILDDYVPPSVSEIKQTGATEQEADTVILLHRSLKPGLVHGDLAKVRMGSAPMSDIAEDRVMRVRVGKCRLDGDAKDHDIRLYLGKGVLYGSPESRRMAEWEGEHGL